VTHDFLLWLHCVQQNKRPETDRRFRASLVLTELLLGH